MTNALFFILGLILGLGMCIILLLLVFRRVDGVLIVDDGDSETTHWTLQVNTDPIEVPKKKKIVLKIQNEGGV